MSRIIRASLACLLILLAVAPSGCSSSEEPAVPVKYVSKKPKTEGTEVVLQTDGKKVVNFYAPKDNTGAIRSVVNKYNDMNDEVYIWYNELDIESFEIYSQYMMALEEGSAEYDLMLLDISWNADFAARGLIAELDGLIAEDGVKLSDFWPNAIEAARYRDKIYSLPVEVGILTLYFRKDLINSAPATWDDLIDLCLRASDDRISKNILAFGGKASHESVFIILNMLNTYGGSFVNAEGRPAIDRPKAAMALEKYRDIYTSAYVPPSMYYMTEQTALDTFTSGDSAMLIATQRGWIQANGKNSKVVGSYALAPLPKNEPHINRSALLTGSVAAIGANSDYIAEAWEFLKYLTGTTAQKALSVGGGYAQSLLEVYDDPDAQLVNAFYSSANFRNALGGAAVRPITPDFFNYMSVLQEQIAEYLAGRADIDKTLDMIESELNRVMKVR